MLLAIAATERMIEEDEAIATTVAPEGIPGPLTLMPTSISSVLARPVIVLEPLVVLPVSTMAA